MNAFSRNCWVSVVAILLVAEPALAQYEVPDNLGTLIADFALRDVSNQEHSLADVADKKLVVVAFMGIECPLAKIYTHRLNELHAQWGPQGVAFFAIDSNRQDDLREVENFVRTYQVTFPFLRDPDQRVADRFGARRTPEIFVLDRERKIRYRGRVDDQFGINNQINFSRPEPQRHDLSEAIADLIDDRPVRVPLTEAPGCLIARSRAPDANSPVTFSQEVVRIFQLHCQECHRPNEIAPFPLLTYEDAAGWSAMIAEVVRDGRMPPWNASPEYGDFINDARLKPEDKQRIIDWAAHGAPEGDPADLPPPMKFPPSFDEQHWDQVIYIADEPFRVPAKGILEYQYFTVNPGFTEDRWIAGTQATPGARPVVHHMSVFVKPPGDFFRLRRQGKVFEIGGYIPGLRNMPAAVVHALNAGEIPEREEEEGRVRIPAGSELVFEMHYTASGVEQFDRSAIGLEFAEPPAPAEERQLAGQEAEPLLFTAALVESTDFAIPPQASEHPVQAWYTFRQDSELGWMNAHLHLRGRGFKFEAFYPDGRHEILLDIPRYDFDWQQQYILRQPKPMPKGTRMLCTAIYDNSTENLRNPDASITVTYGDQTWNEMMSGTMGINYRDNPPPVGPPGTIPTGPPQHDVLAGYLPENAVPAENRAKYFYQRGLFRKGEGDWPGALEDLGQAGQLDPQLADAWYERGELHRLQKHYDLALGDLQRAVQSEPRSAKYLVARGWTRMHLGAREAALADLNEALSIDPWNYLGFYYRARVRSTGGEIEAALADLRRLTTEVNPRFIKGLWEYGMLLMAQGKDAEAKAQFDRCLHFEPELEPTLTWEIGQTRWQQGRLDDAIREFGRLVKLQPDRAAGHLAIGLIHNQQGKADEALQQFRAAVQAEPLSAEAHLRLADALLAQHQATEAITHYHECLRLEPGSVQAANNLAWLLATSPDIAIRNPVEAITLAEGLCQPSQPQQPNYLDTLAAAYAAAGRFEEAVATATRGVDLAMAARQFQLAVKLQERRRQYRAGQAYVAGY